MTDKTLVTVQVDQTQRQLLENVGRLHGMKLATFIRHAAIETARAELDERREAGEP